MCSIGGSAECAYLQPKACGHLLSRNLKHGRPNNKAILEFCVARLRPGGATDAAAASVGNSGDTPIGAAIFNWPDLMPFGGMAKRLALFSLLCIIVLLAVRLGILNPAKLVFVWLPDNIFSICSGDIIVAAFAVLCDTNCWWLLLKFRTFSGMHRDVDVVGSSSSNGDILLKSENKFETLEMY